MSKELKWEEIPEEIKAIARKEYIGDGQLVFANEIMQSIKPIVEKAYIEGMIKMNYQEMPLSYMKSHFETYWNSLIKKDAKDI